MRKGIAVLLALGLLLSFSACGAGNVGGTAPSEPAQSSASSETSSVMPEQDAQDSLEGLEAYLEGNGALVLTRNDKGEVTNRTEMKAALIGASAGAKYVFGFEGNNNITLELYEYDLSDLNETANNILQSAKTEGKMTIMEQTVSEVTVSDSGKYLMIYNDSAIGNEKNAAQKEKVLELFRGFKNK